MMRDPQRLGPLRNLYDSLRAGRLDRRAFIEHATVAGTSLGVAMFLANTAHASASDASTRNGVAFAAQDATSAASPTTAAIRYDAGTENQTRGEGGELRIIQWQAPTSLSPHVVGGSKDYLGSLPVMEPLMHYGVEAELIPNLVTDVPSVENGDLAEDLTSVTFHLIPEVVWSDGTPLTGEDIRFTVEWVQDENNNAVSFSSFEPIESVEVVDDLTATVTFKTPNPFWADAFSGTSSGFVYPRHILESGPEAHDAFMSNPVGTGPFVVESFTPNDSVVYVANENYREPNKPFFSRLQIKGGGDAAAAARAVIQTGEYDYAWNLQVEPNVLDGIVGDGSGPGEPLPFPGVAPEKLNINFSDPNTEVDGQRSEMNTPHPSLSDPAVREAMFKAVDRQRIADEFYGLGQPPTANILQGSPDIESPNTSWEYNPEAAAQILEDAGWVMDGDVRKKDGVELSYVYATSVNSVRQKTQALVKSNLEEIGFKIQLEQVDAGVYFDSAAGNEQGVTHFYWDLCEQQNLPNSPRPIDFMELWYAGPDKSNIAQTSNGWTGGNWVRWVNDDYDAAIEAARVETDATRLAELFIEMNDLVINNHVVMPLVLRGSPAAVSKRLRVENIAPAPFSYDYWNIANWNLADDQGE